MNPTGLVAALAAMGGIWLGHVLVRRIEFAAPVLALPAALVAMLGAVLGGLSLLMKNPSAIAAGILALTFLYDAVEFYRQEKRVQRGHAPANPRNPRHARILRAFPAATLRDPLGEVGQTVAREKTS